MPYSGETSLASAARDYLWRRMWFTPDLSTAARITQDGYRVHVDITNDDWPLRNVRFFVDFFQQPHFFYATSAPLLTSPLPENELPPWHFIVPNHGVCTDLTGAALAPGQHVKHYIYEAPADWLPVSSGPVAVQSRMPAGETRRFTVELHHDAAAATTPAGAALEMPKHLPHIPVPAPKFPVIRVSLGADVEFSKSVVIRPTPGAFSDLISRGVPPEFPGIRPTL